MKSRVRKIDNIYVKRPMGQAAGFDPQRFDLIIPFIKKKLENGISIFDRIKKDCLVIRMGL